MFKFHRRWKTYASAQDACEKEQSTLARVETFEENEEVRMLIHSAQLGKPRPAWIGAQRQGGHHHWRWMGDPPGSEPASFFNWEGTQPDNGGKSGYKEECVQLMPDGSWHDMWCTSVSAFVCQYFGEAQQPPSPPPPTRKKLCPMCDTCSRLLANDGFMFRRMWAAEPWLKLAYDRPTCFSRTRDKGGADHQDANTFFDLTSNGLICSTNWYASLIRIPSVLFATPITDCAAPSVLPPPPRRYEGNFGLLGLPGRTPTFPA
eukprot:6369632-Prymnesium_polylepis.1